MKNRFKNIKYFLTLTLVLCLGTMSYGQDLDLIDYNANTLEVTVKVPTGEFEDNIAGLKIELFVGSRFTHITDATGVNASNVSNGVITYTFTQDFINQAAASSFVTQLIYSPEPGCDLMYPIEAKLFDENIWQEQYQILPNEIVIQINKRREINMSFNEIGLSNQLSCLGQKVYTYDFDTSLEDNIISESLIDVSYKLSLDPCAQIIGVYENSGATNKDIFGNPIGYVNSESGEIIITPINSYLDEQSYGYRVYVTYPCDGTCSNYDMNIQPSLSLSGVWECNQGQITEVASNTLQSYSKFEQCNQVCEVINYIDDETQYPCTSCPGDFDINYQIQIINETYDNVYLDVNILGVADKISLEAGDVTDIQNVRFFHNNKWITYNQFKNLSDKSTVSIARWLYINTTSGFYSILPSIKMLNIQDRSGLDSMVYSIYANGTLTKNQKKVKNGGDLIREVSPVPRQCPRSLNVFSDVSTSVGYNDFKTNTNQDSGEIVTYRLRLQAYNYEYEDIQIEEVLESGQTIIDGSIRYGFLPNGRTVPTADLTPLTSNNNIEINELGQAQLLLSPSKDSFVIQPVNGQEFDLPVSCNSEELIIEFKVRLDISLTANTQLINQPVITNYQNIYTHYYSSKITINSVTRLDNQMVMLCSQGEATTELEDVIVKNGETIDFKMKLVNTGNTPVNVTHLINQKPQPYDTYEILNSSGEAIPRGSQYTIDYDCTTPVLYKIDANGQSEQLDKLRVLYAENPNAGPERENLFPRYNLLYATPKYTSNCSIAANWLSIYFIDPAASNDSGAGILLQPGERIEVVYQGIMSGETQLGNIATNSFSYKANSLSSVNRETNLTVNRYLYEDISDQPIIVFSNDNPCKGDIVEISADLDLNRYTGLDWTIQIPGDSNIYHPVSNTFSLNGEALAGDYILGLEARYIQEGTCSTIYESWTRTLTINRCPITDCMLTNSGVDGAFEKCPKKAYNDRFFNDIECGTGWTEVFGDPDFLQYPLADQMWLYDGYKPDAINTTIPESHDGGIFIGALASVKNQASFEQFSTEITNLQVGQKYRLDFEQINLTHPDFVASNGVGPEANWKVFFGGVEVDAPTMTTNADGSAQWQDVTMEFTATQETQTLTFGAYSLSGPIYLGLGKPYFPGLIYLGLDGVKMIPVDIGCVLPKCEACSSFDLDENEEYLITGWVQQQNPNDPTQQYINYEDTSIKVSLISEVGLVLGEENIFKPTGEIIDGWQRIIGIFPVPPESAQVKIELANDSPKGDKAYFDDIRIHPRDANMKSFVYDHETQRLMSELDENNYSTYYEYDKEGGLIRVKKETERGVFTIQETRSGNKK